MFGKKSENWRSILLDQNLCNPVHHLLSDDQSNQSMQIDNCEWLNNVIKIIVDDDEVWDEIDSKAIDSYQLERQWNAPCLWLSRYPAATIRIYDKISSKFSALIKEKEPENDILSSKFFKNKNYQFSFNGKNYIWKPWEGSIVCGEKKMNFAGFCNKETIKLEDFETQLEELANEACLNSTCD